MTSPSKPCAMAIHSVESAIRSRVTREYFIPIWPIAIPSQTAIAGNTTGVPPAIATPSFTASTILSRFICPGTISLNEETIPISGRSLSSFVYPSALNRLLWGACDVPVFTLSLLISLISFRLPFHFAVIYPTDKNRLSYTLYAVSCLQCRKPFPHLPCKRNPDMPYLRSDALLHHGSVQEHRPLPRQRPA